MLDITCVIMVAMTISSIIMSMVDGWAPSNPSMYFMIQLAAPVFSRAPPSDSAPPKNTMSPSPHFSEHLPIQ